MRGRLCDISGWWKVEVKQEMWDLEMEMVKYLDFPYPLC